MLSLELSEKCSELLAVPERKRFVDNFIKCAVSVFGENPSPYDAGNMHKVDELFDLVTNGGFSHQSFYDTKRLVKILYNIFYESGLASRAMLDRVQQISAADVLENTAVMDNYFASYEEVIGFINGIAKLFDCDAESCLFDFKCIVTFAWLGMSAAQMGAIKKSDVHETFVICGDERFDIQNSQYKVLSDAIRAETYESFPGHRNFVFSASDFILRSFRVDRYTEDAIKGITLRFNNAISGTTNKRVTIEAMRVNGIFARAFIEEISTGCSPNQAVQIVSGRNRSDSHTLSKMYIAWRNRYSDVARRD